MLEVVPSVDPFVALETVSRERGVEDAYLFGVALCAVAQPGELEAVRRALAGFGAVGPAEPSLEDAFVTLVRQRRAAAGGTA